MKDIDECERTYYVERCVIDAQPEGRAAAEFARNNRDMGVNLANYSRRELGTDTDVNGGVRFLALNRTETMEAMFEAFKNGKAELPRNAALGVQLNSFPKLSTGRATTSRPPIRTGSST